MSTQDERAFKLALGATIRRLRLERRLSQEDLAEAAGLHPRYVSDIERGRRNPGIVNVARLATALDLEVSALVVDTPPLGPRTT